MKKLSIILSLFSIGIVLSSCRQSSFIAEDDVYSTGSTSVYTSDKSDASYSNYVYSKESNSGTKSAYYNPEDSISRDQPIYDNQNGTVVNNYYYGNDYLYNNGWNGYGGYGYAPRYRPYSVWWGWGYDPFFYSPWHYGWGMSYGWGMGYGMHYGWGYNPYAWGYNPYAWGYGYGHNPYGWGYGHGGYGCYNNTNIYGNVYNNYGGSGMVTQNSGGYIQSGNSFKGKRPVMAGNSAPYTGPSKVKSAINSTSGKPVKVEKVSAIEKNSLAAKPTVSKIESGARSNQVATHQLTSSSKPWVPETAIRSEKATDKAVRESDAPRLVDGVRKTEGQAVRTNSGRVETGETIRPNVPTTVRTTPAEKVGRENQTIQRRENTTPQNNQWNRGTTTPPRATPQSTPRNNQNMNQPRGGGSYNSSPAPSRGGSIGGGSSPSRGSSVGGGSSPSRGSSMGGSSSSPSRGSSSGSRGGGRP